MKAVIAELEVQRGENRVPLGRTESAIWALPPLSATCYFPLTPGAFRYAAGPVAATAPPAPAENELIIKSPIVGTFYESSSPGSPPLCASAKPSARRGALIIESMKLMNEIEAEMAGGGDQQAVGNGQPGRVRGGPVWHPPPLRKS